MISFGAFAQAFATEIQRRKMYQDLGLPVPPLPPTPVVRPEPMLTPMGAFVVGLIVGNLT